MIMLEIRTLPFIGDSIFLAGFRKQIFRSFTPKRIINTACNFVSKTNNFYIICLTMSFVEVEPFKVDIIPDTTNAQIAVREAINGFKTISHSEVQDPLLLDCKIRIHEQGQKFQEVTTKSVDESIKMANHCDDIISYVRHLMDDRITGKDFLDTLKELVRWAEECRKQSERFKNDYTDILSNLHLISRALGERAFSASNESQTKKHEANKLNNKRKGALLTATASGLASIGLHATTAATLGGSALVTGPIGGFTTVIAIEASQKHSNYKNKVKNLKSECAKLDEIVKSIMFIINQTESIIQVVGSLRDYWGKLAANINIEIQKFKHSIKQKDILYYNKLKGKSVIKQWESVQQQFRNYENNVRDQINSYSRYYSAY